MAHRQRRPDTAGPAEAGHQASTRDHGTPGAGHGQVARPRRVPERAPAVVADADVANQRSAADWTADPAMHAAHGFVAPAMPVQMSPATSTGSAPAGDEAAADQVAMAVTWSGKFGGDLSAHVKLEGETSKNKWQQLDTETVADADLADGERAQELSAELRGARHGKYRVAVEPTAAAPDDRYRKTTKTVAVAADRDHASTRVQLSVNRWNSNNVSDAWSDKGIDPDKAKDTVRTSLFGRALTVNKLVEPRVQRTQALFDALPEATQQEIRESIAIMGGYAKRTTSTGAFSNHSTGCAIDLNYNMATRQNYHFYQDAEMPHLDFVQRVVESDPEHAGFRIREHTGQAQLEASRVFNRRFPFYLAELLDMDTSPQLDQDPSFVNLFDVRWWLQQLHAMAVSMDARQLLGRIQRADIEKARDMATDSGKKEQLTEVIMYWDYSKQWIEGATVHDDVDDQDKTLVGMVPIHESLLQVFLDAGWDWGGDWRFAKDYMHFEDKDALNAIEAQAGGQEP